MLEIRMGEKCVGYAQIDQKGLYYHVNCSCNPPGKDIHRIIMHSEGINRDLGICVPKGDEYYLFTRVPIKQFSGKSFTFELISSKDNGYTVADNMPFAHLDKLETAHLKQINGQSTIVIYPNPNLQDSGQSREYPNK